MGQRPNLTEKQVVLLSSRTTRASNLGLHLTSPRDAFMRADAKATRERFPNGDWLPDSYSFPPGRVAEIEAYYDHIVATNTHK